MIKSVLCLRRYLSSEDKKSLDASSKRADYTRVVSAVKRLGFPDEAAHTIWRVLAAILHLGNMQFEAKVRIEECSADRHAGIQSAVRHSGSRRACNVQAVSGQQAGREADRRSQIKRATSGQETYRQKACRKRAGR